MVQVIQARQRQERPSFMQSLLGGVGQALPGAVDKYQEFQKLKKQKEGQLDAAKKLGIDPEVFNLPEKAQSEYFKNQFSKEGKQAESAEKLKGNTGIIRDAEKRYGFDEGELDPYIQNPALGLSIAEKTTRVPKKTQASQPIDPDQLKKIESVRNSPEYESANPAKRYQMLTRSGVSKENAHSEADISAKSDTLEHGKVESAYKAQKDFIDETTSRYSAFETEMKPRLMQMQNIPDEDVISPESNLFLQAVGIPLGFLDNPSSELYDKLSHDLLKGLPETFGNRILKVEVDNFLKTIPSLSNSVEGRRMIASNMLKLGEMKEVYYNEMRKQQKSFDQSGKPLPRDFQQEVFDQVRPQINRINDEFAKMVSITSIPKGEIAFFNPNGDIEFVPKEHAEWATKNGGRRIW